MGVTKSGIVIAGISAAEQEVHMTCLLCGTPWTREECRPGGPYERHIRACVEENEGVINETRERTQGFHGSGDLELEAWVRRNAEAIIEGRKTDAYGKKLTG